MPPSPQTGSHFEFVQAGLDSSEIAFTLLQRFFREEGFQAPPEMRAALEAMIAGPGSAVFLARQGGQMVGVATVQTAVGLEYGLSAEMDDLYVLPEARSQGLASALIEAVQSWCAALGCRTLLVTVTPEGESAHGLIGFYKRRGFEDHGRVILELDLCHMISE